MGVKNKLPEKWVRTGTPVLVLLLCVFSAWSLFGTEYRYVLQWYGACLALTCAGVPLAWALFADFDACGSVFAKPLALMLSGGLMWMLSVFHILPFTRGTAYLCAAACLAGGAGVWYFRNRQNPAAGWNRIQESIPETLWLEVAFFILLAYWAHLKGSDPAAYGTEKFMDYGFLAAMDKSIWSPAQDMWYAGKGLNYYYVGQFLSAYFMKLSGDGPEYGYNLMMMTLPAIGFLECFGIVRQLLKPFANGKKWIGIAGGITAGTACTFAGNMHYVLYGLLGMPNVNGNAYYYPDSTRFIGYNPDIPDKTIHEFPSYSFIISDLHAHVVNYIFVLAVIALLLAWSLRRRARMEAQEDIRADRLWPVWETLCAEVIPISIFIGMFMGINFWDFPIYYVTSGAVILFMNARMYRNVIDTAKATALQGVFVMITAFVVSYPFRSRFDMISSHVYLTDRHTVPYQIIVLWGLPLTVCAVFYAARFMEQQNAAKESAGKSAGKNKKSGQNEKPSVLESVRTHIAGFFAACGRDIAQMRTEDVFAMILALCAAGLVLMPELVYVQDIYGHAYQRTNTMFKLTYQAYIMFALCFGYMLPRLMMDKEHAGMRWTGRICAFLLFLTLGFFVNACNTRFGGVFGKGYDTLNASAFMNKQTQAEGISMLDDAAAVQWLNENVTEYPTVILEADAESYTFGARISVFTGQPTVLGWRAHEWLWRSDADNPTVYPASVAERDGDVQKIYTSENRETVEELLEKYDISYIVYGYEERHNGIWENSYHDTDSAGEFLKSLGEVVFESKNNPDEPLWIIRVDRAA